MVPINFTGMSAKVALEKIEELKSSGLVLNVDFEWKFYPEQRLNIGEIIEKRCEFKFAKSKLATFYALKWNKT